MAKLRIINPYTGFDSKKEKEQEYEGIGKAYRPTDAVQKKKEIEMLSSAAGNGKTRFQNFVASTQADMQRRKEQQEQEAREMAAEMLTAPAERFQYTAGAEYLAMKKQQEEKQKRVQYAEDLSKNYGYKNIAGKAVYVTPFSPLPKPTKENTASRAQAPGAYGIAPEDYLKSMGAIDKYINGLPEYFPNTDIVIKNGPPDAKSFLSTNTSGFVENWFDGQVPTMQDVLAKYSELNDLDKQRFWTEYENTAGELQSYQAEYQKALEQYEQEQLQRKAAYDEALKMLGVDAEQYAGGTTADYLGRYGQTYGVERHADAYKDNYKVPGVFGNYDEHDATMHSIMNRGKENEYSGTSLETGRTLLQQKMTDEQANTYMALAEQYGEDVAQEYFQSLLSDGANGEDSYNKQAYGIREAALINEARANWLKATGKSFLNVPGQLAGTMYSIEQGLKGEEIDPYDTAFMPGQAVQTPRSEVNDMITRNFGTVDKAGEYHDNLWSWLMKAGYNAATSGGDSALSGILTLGMPGAGAAMQGAWSMGGSVQDATARGASTEQALLLGGINAIIETATEYLPMDHLIKTIEAKDIKTFGQLMLNAFWGGVKEAPGEGFSTFGSYISDDLIMGKMSNWDALVKEKGVFGAAKQVAGEVLTDAFVGFLSGESSNMIGGVKPLLTNNMNGTKQADNAPADQQAEPIPELVESAPIRAEQIRAEQEAAVQNAPEQTMPVASVQNADETMPADDNRNAPVQDTTKTQAQEGAEAVEKPSATENKGADSKPSSEAKNGKNAHVLNKNLTAAVINNGGVNEVVRVSGIDRVADGTVYVRVTDQAGNERVESSENLDFAGDVNELLGSSDVKQLDEGSMAAYLNGYDSSLATPPVYMRAYMGVYNRARSGLDYMQSVVMSEAEQRALTTEAANEAYMAGMSQYNTENGVQVGMTRRMQESVIDVLNKATGGKIRLVDSDLGGANARYDKKTGVIEISTKAEKGAYAYYAMHETVHKLKNENQQAWGKFQTLMEDTLLTHDVDIDAEMARVTELYKKQGQNLTPDEALEEVICNSAPAILQDAEIVKEMFAKDRTTMEKVTDFLRDVLDKMTSVLKGLGDDMGELGSWKGMQALKNDHESLKAIYDCLMEGLEATNQQAQQETATETDADEGGYKYSFAPGGKLASNGIERDMPDAERAEVLRNMEIQTVPTVELSTEAQELVERLGKGGMRRKDIYNAIMALPEYKAIHGKDLINDSTTVPFQFSNGSLDETLKKMEVHGHFNFKQAQQFVGLLGNFTTQVKKAKAVEVHTDRYLHRVYDTTKIENYGALFGIADNGNTEVPVLYELKNFKGNEKDKLYLVATFEETKKGPTQGSESADYSANTAPTNAGTYIVADYVPKINPLAGNLLKYFPNELMNPEQIKSAEIARLAQEKYILAEKIGVGNIDLKDGKPVQQSQVDEIDRQIEEIRKGSFKNSLREDSTGSNLTKEQQEYFAESKVRDENGNLMVMYHGTPNGNYDRFRSGTYFTPMKDYADVYQNQSASSISVKKNADNPQTYQVYLNMMKPFDTRNPKERRIFMNEYYRQWGTGTPLMESGLPDWTDGMDLQEFIEEMGYDYDGLILDEGGVPDDNGGVKSRGLSYVIFDPAQAKTTDNLTPTDDERFKFSLKEPVEETRDLIAVHNLTEDNMRSVLELGGLAMPSIAVIKAEQGHSQYGTISVVFDKSTIDPKASSANEVYGADAWTPTFPQVQYEADSKAESRIRDKYYELEPKVGNQTARVLYRFATDLEEELNRNGGVSEIIKKLEGNTDMMQLYLADNGQQAPEPVKKTIVKRTPKIQAEQYDSLIQKIGEDVMRSFETPEGEKVGDHRRAWMDEHGEALKQAYVEVMADATGLPEENVAALADNKQNVRRMLLDAYNYMKTGGETREEMTDYEATEKAIRDACDENAYKKWLNDLFEGAEKSKGIRNQTALFTPSGNRRSFSATHWDVTLDNVVRAMRGEEKTGVGMGGRNIEGAAVKKYGSIKDVKADSGRLQKIDQDEYDAMRKSFRDRFSAIARAYAGEGDWFDAGDVLVEAVTKYQTVDGIYNYISKYSKLYKPSKQVANDLFALVEEMKNAPTGYFEAKPRRAVGFEEMAAVIIPDNLSEDVRTGLEDKGVAVLEYKAGDEADRLNKLNSDAVSEYKFSLRETDETVQDSLAASEKLFTMTHGHLMSDKDAKWMADKVKALAQSKTDTTELMNEIKRIYSYAERGENVSMEQMDSERIALAEKVMAESKTLDTVHEERVKPIRDYLRTTRISLTDEQRKEAASLTGNIGAYRRMMFGRVRLTQDGMPLDTVWGELNALDSKLFPADAGEAEMASLLLDAVDAIAPIYQNNSGMNAMEAAQWLAMEMDNKYFALGGVQKTVKEQERLAVTLRQYRDVMDRFQKEHKVVFDEKMAKVKASMDEEKAKVLQQAENQRRLDKLEAEADARAYANEQIADVKAKSAAEMEAYREAMRAKDKEFRETYKEKAKETSRKQRYREQIVRMENELVKRLEKPTDKKHIMAGLDEAVLEFVTSLNLGGKNKRTRDLSTRIHQLKDAMGEAQKDADKHYLIDPDLLVDMDTLAKEVKGLGNLSELTADQMRDMRDMVKAVTHIVNTADQMFTMKKRVTTGQVAQNFMDEASRKKDKKKREGFMGMVDEMVNEGMLDSFRFFDRLGTSARELFQSLRNGFDEKVRCVAQANDYVQEQAKNLDKDIVKGKKAKKTAFQLSGGTIELTKAQVMELYCLSKRDQARKHLYNGGIRTENAVKPVMVNEADVQKIIDSLSAAECRVADALQLFMAKNCAEWGNQTSMTLYGYRKFGEKNYYPITVDKNTTQTMQTEAGQDENLYAILNMGMTKSLNEKATNALMIGDIFDTFSRHVDNMSTYRAYAAPIADMLRWYNWKSMDGQSVKTMLERKFGAKGRDYISLLIRDINGQNKANYSPGFMEKATQKAKSASVGANLRVAIQQPTAIARAADMMSPKYIAAGLTMSKKQMGRAIQLAQEYCPIAKWKSMGFYETHIGKGLRDMMFGGQGALQTVGDKSMWLAGKMDEVTWGALWRACEKETRALHPDLKGEALYEETGKRLGRIIDYTQVVDTPLHRSQMMRSKNYGVQMATAFMSEPSKTYNMLYSAISRFAENRRDPVAKAKLARCITTYAATALLNALAQSVMDAVRDDDENETFAEKYLDALGGNAVDNINPLGMLPYAKDILSMMQGYDPSRMDMQAIEKFVQIATELRKVVTGEDSKWSVHMWIRSTASALSYATGVPLENAMRDLTSIANTFSMQFGGKPLPMQHETATTSYAYENMYDALMSGDKTTWNRIDGKLKADEESPKSNSTIDTGIGKLLSEEDERIAQAWEAKAAGKASEMSRIRQEIVNELAETGVLDKERLNEIVDKAITTYGNAVTPKEEKAVDTEKQLKVKMYTQADASQALRDMADGKVSEADVKAILSEVVADSEAKDPEKSVRSNVISDVKKDWLAATKSSDTRKANSLSSAMKTVLGVTKAEMDKWLTDSYADDLRTAVDAYSTGNAKNVIAKLRARGLDDYDIKDKLSKYRQLYIDAMKRGDRATANRIKSTLMGLGLKYKSGDPMYTDSTFSGWMK